jgi:hypothetical protein
VHVPFLGAASHFNGGRSTGCLASVRLGGSCLIFMECLHRDGTSVGGAFHLYGWSFRGCILSSCDGWLSGPIGCKACGKVFYMYLAIHMHRGVRCRVVDLRTLNDGANRQLFVPLPLPRHRRIERWSRSQCIVRLAYDNEVPVETWGIWYERG